MPNIGGLPTVTMLSVAAEAHKFQGQELLNPKSLYRLCLTHVSEGLQTAKMG